MKTCLWYMSAKVQASSIFVMITKYSFSLFLLQDGFIDFFRTDDGPADNNANGWRVAAVAGLGLGALLVLACR